MKKQLLCFTLYAIIIYLTVDAINLAAVASPPVGGDGTHFCGVNDSQWNKRHSDQFPNRHYARTSATNLNVGEPLTVRIIYFLPSDSQPQPDIDTELDTLIKGAQHHYIEVMEGHGFGRKTFAFETDAHGKAVVHHIDGQFTDAYYIDDTTSKVLKEVEEQFDTSKNIYFIGIKISNHGLDSRTACGIASLNGAIGGVALLPTSGDCFNVSVTAHELGHVFGLTHDYRTNAKVVPSPYTFDTMTTSFCAAEWLDAHRYFNTERESQDNFDTTIQMLPANFISEPSTIRLRFEVTDPNGLHQAQLLIPEETFSGGFIACKRLEGTSSTVEFVTAELTTKSNRVTLNVMDVHGNFTWHSFSLNILALLPPSKAISIPDANLAAAVREALKLAPGTALTSHTMLELTYLNAPDRGVTDLTGLEYAHNLKELWLDAKFVNGTWVSSNAISDLSPIEGLTQLYWLMLANPSHAAVSALPKLKSLRHLQIYNPPISDVSVIAGLTQLRTLQIYNPSTSNVPALLSALAGLTQLRTLTLEGVPVSDISVLAGLTQLTRLDVERAAISDLSPLAGLTNLEILWLGDNNILDISPLAGLTNLGSLRLQHNAITDISRVAGLTNLRQLYLYGNSISDISPLSELVDLRELQLSTNPITDISPVAGLTQLRTLASSNNSISDLSPLVGLTNLVELWLGGNNISDISPLAGLTNLGDLRLWDNNISDISPLAANTELGNSDWVNVMGNPLSYQSIHKHILTLESRGVTVRFDNRSHPALLKISGDNQKGVPFVPLSEPFVVEAQDENGSVLAGISVTFAVIQGGGMLSETNTRTDPNGRAQSTLTLGPNLGRNTVQVSAAGIEVPATFHALYDTELPPIEADVNGDGNVNILDLVAVASEFESEKLDLAADVNEDGIINILDLILVAGMFGAASAAPSVQPQVPETLTAAEVQDWLTDAKSLEVKDLIMKRGIGVLEQLVVSLTPTETELLANYPNPFNPETWIPYRLAEDAFVTLTIYDQSGQIIRTLDVGHRIAAVYENRSKAVYWDGRNSLGEQVASGIYFYHLSAGDFSATRKMVILK